MNSSGDSNSHQFWVAAAACMAAAAARTSVTNLSQGKLNPSRIKFWATFEKSFKQEMVQGQLYTLDRNLHFGANLSKGQSDLKMHKTSDTIFRHSSYCSFTQHNAFCFECQLEKPLSLWLKFFNSQSKTSISRFLKLTLRTKWITPCERA